MGTIHNVEFIDDRWRDGLPNRVITVLDPPTPPDRPDPRKIRTSMVEVLDGPSTFQAEAASIQKGDAISFGSVKATFRLLGTSELPVSWSQS